MITFIVRRLVAAFFIVLAASFIVYMLMANAGDPLAFTAEIANPTQRQAIIDSVTEELNLDVNPVARYFLWLGDCAARRLRDLRPHPATGHRRPERAGSR